MQPLQDNIKSEIYYFVKHLAPLGYTFHKLLVHCSPADRRKFEGESKAMTRFVENIKRSPRHHEDEVRHVQPTAAPVIAAVHQHLQQHFPERFTKMSSSGPPLLNCHRRYPPHAPIIAMRLKSWFLLPRPVVWCTARRIHR